MDRKVLEVSSLSLSFSDYLPTYLCIIMYIYLSIYLPIYLSIYLSIYLPTCPICKLENGAILRDPLYFWTWQRQKRSNSARLPQFLNSTSKTQQFCEASFNVWTWQRQKRSNSARRLHFWTTSKTKQFCETSSIFELDNVKNDAILRDFLIFRSWQHQKRNNSARRPSKMESWVQSWRPRTNAFCDFSTPPV